MVRPKDLKRALLIDLAILLCLGLLGLVVSKLVSPRVHSRLFRHAPVRTGATTWVAQGSGVLRCEALPQVRSDGCTVVWSRTGVEEDAPSGRMSLACGAETIVCDSLYRCACADGGQAAGASDPRR